MAAFILSRLVSLVVSLFAASLVIFTVIEVIPGDPAAFMLGLNAAEDTVAALRTELGLDGSVVARYVGWVWGMMQGDFGISYTYRVPVADLIAQRVGVSLPLAAMALTLSTAIAVPVGIVSAAYRGRGVDYGIMGVTQLIETQAQDYMRTARAKGLSTGQTLRRHGLRNAMIPVLTILGLQFSFLMAGAIIIENVFYLPGLGRLIFQGITQRDLVVVEGVTMLLVCAVILVTFLVDLAYGLADPRLRRR
jgi:ABC-type dipeptide/oligopeptide/nickel transport system permease component